MSISIDSINASRGLQPQSQTSTQPVAGSSVPGAALNSRAASVSGGLPSTPAVKAATDAKEVRVVSESEAAKVSTEQTRQSLEDINRVLTGLSISVQFQIDPEYKDVIVRVVDQDSGKVVRQIPTVEVVRIAKAMDNLKGLLFAQTA
jgi:flagellar protein FlaG